MPRVLENVRERLVVELEAMMADPTAGVSLRALAERVGIGVGTIYNYFPDKDQLILEVLDREWSRTIAGVHEAIRSAEPNLESRVQLMLELLYDDLERLVRAGGRRKAVMDGVAGDGNEHRAPLPLRPELWRRLVEAFAPVWEAIRSTGGTADAHTSSERLTVMTISTLSRLIVAFPDERHANIAFVQRIIVRGGCLYG